MTALSTATTEEQAGAAPRDTIDWHAMNWRQVTETVRRLQVRIVKAVQVGRWGKVKALQHLLTHSFSGKALAVRRVTENQGKRTPGVDGVTWDRPKQKAEAIAQLRHHGYHALPLRRVYIAKENGRQRGLGIPTMRDRAMHKHSTCSPSIPLRKRPQTRPPTGFARNVPLPMRSNNASWPWQRSVLPNGWSKAIFVLPLTS